VNSTSLKILAAILFLFLAPSLFSQRILVLEKLGSGKRYTYNPGDNITLKWQQNPDRFTGNITGITDSGFVLDMKIWIGLGDVQMIWRRSPHRKSMGNRIIIAGGVFAGIMIINNLANNETVVDPVYIGIAAGISALGVLWRASSVQSYHLGNRWKLKVLDTTFL
jgi:hypothetical protein